MTTRTFAAFAAICLTVTQTAFAVRVMTTPSTAPTDPQLEFDNITLTPDGTTFITSGLFDGSLTGDFVYSLPVPADPNTDTVAITAIITDDFSTFDSNGPAVVSPDGTTVLYTNDRETSGEYTIRSTPVGGGALPSNGLFTGAVSNNVAGGSGNFNPKYSADGNTIFFINNETGHGGSVPTFTTDSFGAPDWDQIYSVPATGGTTVTPITLPADGDIDINLWDIAASGNIIYAPDQEVAVATDRGGQRPKIFSIPSTGGSSTEIVMPAASHVGFTIDRQLRVTPDGNNVLFIGDYETVGKFELFTVPVAGGTPSRVSDDLPFGGDVTSFEISPDGTKVAYAAGQNTSANNELFLKDIAGAAGTSIRVSDPPSSNGGAADVLTATRGVINFSNDGSQIYYLGDFTNNGVFDLYAVDTTEKTGNVPTSYTYTGLANGDFFDESNWTDPNGNSPAAASIEPGQGIVHSLIIDGDTVGSTGGQVDFTTGGSLELTAGSVLNLTNPGDQLDFNANSAFKITDATVNVDDDIYLEGTNDLNGGTITSAADDIEFLEQHETSISGTTFVAGDNILINNSASDISGATFQPADRLGMRFTADVTVTDTLIEINSGNGDLEDAFAGPQGEGSTLTLKGNSQIILDSVAEGVDLVLDDSSTASFRSLDFDMISDNLDPNDPPPPLAYESRIIVNSFDASFSMTFNSQNVPFSGLPFDLRPHIINGLTGLSYADDPSAWNDPNWNGFFSNSLVQLASPGIDGDFNSDGIVDGFDFLAWQRGESPDPLSAGDLALWETNYGNTSAVAATQQVPEPSSGLLTLLAIGYAACSRPRRARLTAGS